MISIKVLGGVEYAEGEPTEDGRVIVYYDKRGRVVAVEITDITTL